MATQAEVLKRMDEAATNAEHATDAYYDVLTSEGEQDIPLVDGTTTPNLNKRLSGMTNSVQSVSGKTGHVELEPSDIGYPTLELLDRREKEARFVVDESGLSQQQWNNGVESIADLLTIPNPRDGSRVYVKSYHPGLGKGGGAFVYNSEKALINDSIHCFNGWVRQIENNTYTPYMSGCKCDGVTDDGANLEKLMYYLEANNLCGDVVISSDMYINTLVPYTGKLQHHLNEKIGIRLVSNVYIEIKPSITVKFGNVFDDAHTSILSAMWRPTPTDHYGSGQNTNIKIFGGGTLDFTQTGGMATKYWGNRYAIHMGSTLDFEVFDITFRGGTFSNTIAGAKWGSDHNIHHCKFIDTFTDSGTHNDDHSTIYLPSDNSNCYRNIFSLSSISGRYIACTCELHGNNQKYFNNVIKGYWSAVYLTAMKAAWEHSAGDTVTGQQAFNNDAECSARFFWFDGTSDIKIKSFSVHDNNIKYIDYPTDAELASIGKTRAYRGTEFFDIISATSTQLDYVFGAIDALKVYNNTQAYADQSNADYSTFMNSAAIFGKNLKVYNNVISAKQLINANGSLTVQSYHIIDGFEFRDNIIDSSKLSSNSAIGIRAYTFSNANINIELGKLAHDATSSSFMAMTLTNGSGCAGNSIVIKCPAKYVSKRTGFWFEPYGSSSSFSDDNCFSVPYNCAFSSYTSGTNLVYYTTSTQTLGASYGKILSTDWFPTTSKLTSIPRFSARERRTGSAATLLFTVLSSEDISSLAGNQTIPIQLYKDM